MIFYSDASFYLADRKAGIACIAMSDEGQVIETVTKQCAANDVVAAELQGILESAKLASKLKCDKGTLMSDCAIAVGMLNDPSKVSEKYRNSVQSILALKGNLNIEWGGREGNSRADALAMLALRRSELENRESGCFDFHI